MTPEQQHAIVAAAVRAVVADYQITRDLESARTAIAAYDDLVDAVCLADPAAAQVVTQALARRRELERERASAAESARFRAHLEQRHL